MSIGKKLLALRQRENLSQEELAQKLHVSRQTISKWESDLSLPDMKMMLSIAEFYHVSVTELLGIDNEEQSDKSVEYIYEQTNLVLENIQKETQKRKTRDIIILCAICITCFISICFAVVLSIKVMQLQKRPVVNNQFVTSENQEESLVESFDNIDDNLIYDFDKEVITVNYKCILKQYTNKTTVKINMIDVNDKEYQYEMKKINDYTFGYNQTIPLVDYKTFKVMINLGDGIEKTETYAESKYLSKALVKMMHLSMPKNETNHLVKNELNFYTDFSNLEVFDKHIEYKGVLKGNVHITIYKSKNTFSNWNNSELVEVASQDVPFDKKTTIKLSQDFGNRDRVHYLIKTDIKGSQLELNSSAILIEDTNYPRSAELIDYDNFGY